MYYPISALRRDRLTCCYVLFLLQVCKLKTGETVGTEVKRFRKTIRGRSVFLVYRQDRTTEALTDHAAPSLFRPVSLERYPDALPAPATLMRDVDWHSEHPQPEAPDIADCWEELYWPAAAYRVPPNISRAEAELRVMRALRTDATRDIDAGSRRPKGWGSVIDSVVLVARGGLRP